MFPLEEKINKQSYVASHVFFFYRRHESLKEVISDTRHVWSVISKLCEACLQCVAVKPISPFINTGSFFKHNIMLPNTM